MVVCLIPNKRDGCKSSSKQDRYMQVWFPTRDTDASLVSDKRVECNSLVPNKRNEYMTGSKQERWIHDCFKTMDTDAKLVPNKRN